MALTEEHLVPRSLGGRRTLREAVCEPCRRLTGRLEQATLDREFAVPRTVLSLKRRRSRGKVTGRLPPVLLAGDAAAAALAAAQFPRTFALPVFEPAGLLVGMARGSAAPRIEFASCTLGRRTPGRGNVAARPPLADPRAYGYAIAKWAYGLAVAERGLDAGDMQPLRDLLLGRRDDVFNFVGSPVTREATTTATLHAASLHEIDGCRTLRLALFASAGMTPYEVVLAMAEPGLNIGLRDA